jgi:putative hemolysin
VSSIALEALLIVVLLLINGLFAMSELAIVTARRSRLQRRAEAGDTKSAAALELASNPAQFLSAVQIGITLVGTLAGAYGGATIAEQLAPLLSGLPLVGDHGEALALGLVVAAITYLALILGELVPKRIALGHPEQVARLVARPMRMVSRVGRPLVWFLTNSSNLVLKVVRFRTSEEPHVTADDVRAVIAQATAAGAVREEEQEILGRVLHLGDRSVAAAMTPRTSIPSIPVGASARDLRRLVMAAEADWLLLCEGTIDDVVGAVDVRRALTSFAGGGEPDLGGMVRMPLYIPESLTLLQVLEALRDWEIPVAVVLDEFGGVQGMVTFSDVVAHLIGDLRTSPGADGAPDIVRQPDGTWLIAGSTAFEELEETLGVEPAQQGARRDYHTVAGMVLDELGRLPAVGEAVHFCGIRFEVIQMDGQRIARISADPAAGPTRVGQGDGPAAP